MTSEISNRQINHRERTGKTYVLDNVDRYGQLRYELLSEMFDGITIRALQLVGVQSGWNCLEPGAGAGSIARWLAKRVGSTGHVLATELDTTLLRKVSLPNLEVRQHDLVRDPLPQGSFDLVHMRLVLMHLPERERVLAKVADAVKPGGWLLLEEFDSFSLVPRNTQESCERLLNTSRAFHQFMGARGVDLGYGRSLGSSLLNCGFKNVRAEGSISLWPGGSSGCRFIKSTFQELREPLLLTGLVDETEYAADLSNLDNANSLFPSPVMWTATGQRPMEQPR